VIFQDQVSSEVLIRQAYSAYSLVFPVECLITASSWLSVHHTAGNR
jgi:hypothetical protein